MTRFLTGNEWDWRLLRTIAQGVLGVFVANIDMIGGARSGYAGACRGVRDGGALAYHGRDRGAPARGRVTKAHA